MSDSTALPDESVTAVSPASADSARVRRLLLKAGVYTAPVVLASALTVQNAYASSNQNGQGQNKNGQGQN